MRIIAASLEFFVSKLAIFVEHKVVIAGVTRSLRNVRKSLGALIGRKL